MPTSARVEDAVSLSGGEGEETDRGAGDETDGGEYEETDGGDWTTPPGEAPLGSTWDINGDTAALDSAGREAGAPAVEPAADRAHGWCPGYDGDVAPDRF